LYFAPGEEYQFDWSQETVELGGTVQAIKAGLHYEAFITT